nr:hypothetical protein [Neisseria lactamica]
MRFKTEYGKNKIDTYDKEGEKRNSVIGKTLKCMPAITPNRSANPHASVAVSVWNTVHPKGKRLTLQVNGEIRQDPGEDRYLTPWAEAAVYLRNKNKIAIASRHTGHTVFKAFCKIKAAPRYAPRNTRLVSDGSKFKMTGMKFKRHGFRAAAAFPFLCV